MDFERHLLRPDWFLKALWLHFLWTISLFDKPKIWFPSLSSLNRWLKGNIPRNTIFNILWEVNTQQDGREDVSIMCGCEQRTHILLSIPKDAGFTGVLHLLMIMLWYDSWQLTFCARRISLRSCLFSMLVLSCCCCWNKTPSPQTSPTVKLLSALRREFVISNLILIGRFSPWLLLIFFYYVLTLPCCLPAAGSSPKRGSIPIVQPTPFATVWYSWCLLHIDTIIWSCLRTRGGKLFKLLRSHRFLKLKGR